MMKPPKPRDVITTEIKLEKMKENKTLFRWQMGFYVTKEELQSLDEETMIRVETEMYNSKEYKDLLLQFANVIENVLSLQLTPKEKEDEKKRGFIP